MRLWTWRKHLRMVPKSWSKKVKTKTKKKRMIELIKRKQCIDLCILPCSFLKLASPRSQKSNLYSKWEGLDRDSSDYHNNWGQTKSWTLKLLCGGGGIPLVWWCRARILMPASLGGDGGGGGGPCRLIKTSEVWHMAGMAAGAHITSYIVIQDGILSIWHIRSPKPPNGEDQLELAPVQSDSFDCLFPVSSPKVVPCQK